MGKVKETKKEVYANPPPALTPEGREGQLIALATNLAEEQLRNGTASAQVICHYLKLGSTREKREQEKLKEEIKLLGAKTSAVESNARIEELYTQAIAAMKTYGGHGDQEDYENI